MCGGGTLSALSGAGEGQEGDACLCVCVWVVLTEGHVSRAARAGQWKGCVYVTAGRRPLSCVGINRGEGIEGGGELCNTGRRWGGGLGRR